MSALPPITPRALAPTPASANAVRDARAMFFKEMGKVPPSPAANQVNKPMFAAPSAPAAPFTPTSSTSAPEDLNRLRRPGSLLNILV